MTGGHHGLGMGGLCFYEIICPFSVMQGHMITCFNILNASDTIQAIMFLLSTPVLSPVTWVILKGIQLDFGTLICI